MSGHDDQVASGDEHHPRSTSPARILVVDDSRTQRLIIKRTMESLGVPVEIVEASDGLSGLIRLRDASFDLVLLDINMPRVSGVEMLQALRENNTRTHVVMLSADEEESVQETCRQSGATAFVRKPIEPRQLIGAVSAMLRGRPPAHAA